MAQNRMQPRDYEILRALLRMRYLTTRELRAAFFQGERAAQRRLALLSSRDLMRPHGKGLPPHSNYSAWRLTVDGIALVEKEFPNEPIPDGLAERLGEGSLYNLAHREALARAYFDLLRGDASNAADVAAFVAGMSRRSSQLTWQPDGEVVLHFERYGKRQRIIPDATLTSLVRPLRLFVELDRSTKPLPRIEEDLDGYLCWKNEGKLARPPHDADGKGFMIVYIVRSEARKASIRRMGEKVFGRHVDGWAQGPARG